MKIHLIGVGGAAMGNLAAMLKRSGHKVSGSDHDLYPPMSDRLKEWKIDARPFAPRSVHGKDLIIVGNAISRGNPELEEALRLGLPITSMAAALHDFFLRGKKVIVVAGTHGKTTTTFLTDYLIGEAALGGSEKAKGRAVA
ncbi:MAG: UDP-N-acetylmuramate--alanine ligase, partial [Leptospiraceae bacterium]|nr:UDP-N-acetylmuramate--alanine ligase [Leptospiraceae bacterium]